MNLLTAENSFKAGIKRKQKRAGRKNEYLSNPCWLRAFMISPCGERLIMLLVCMVN